MVFSPCRLAPQCAAFPPRTVIQITEKGDFHPVSHVPGNPPDTTIACPRPPAAKLSLRPSGPAITQNLQQTAGRRSACFTLSRLAGLPLSRRKPLPLIIARE